MPHCNSEMNNYTFKSSKEFVKNTDLSAFFSRKRRLSDCKIKEMSF